MKYFNESHVVLMSLPDDVDHIAVTERHGLNPLKFLIGTHERGEQELTLMLPVSDVDRDIERYCHIAIVMGQFYLLYLDNQRVAWLVNCNTRERQYKGRFVEGNKDFLHTYEGYTFDPITRRYYTIV